MSDLDELKRLDAWRRKCEAAGYRVIAEAWAPAPATRPAPIVEYSIIGAAVKRAAGGT